MPRRPAAAVQLQAIGARQGGPAHPSHKGSNERYLVRDAPPKSQLRFRFLFFEASTTPAKYENHDVFTDLAIAGIGAYSNKKYVCISSILSIVFAFSKRLPNRKIHHHHWGLSSLSSFLSIPNLQGSTEVLQLSLVYIRG